MSPARQSIPAPIEACPPPCDRGTVSVADDDGGEVFYGPHPECDGSGLADQVKYAPADRLRRTLGAALAAAGVRVPADVLDRVTVEVASEAARIVSREAQTALKRRDDVGVVEVVVPVIREALSTLRRPLAYASCLMCRTSGSTVTGAECDPCGGRGFIRSRPLTDFMIVD